MAINFRKMPTGGKRKKGDNMEMRLPLNLQFFADSGEGGSEQNNQHNDNNQQSAGVDYNKLQEMIDTATAKKENAVIKDYFVQQGLSENELHQAIAAYKKSKEQQSEQRQNANTELQNEVAAAKNEAKQSQIELVATMTAVTLGVDAKTIPYLVKLADFSKAVGNDGKISEDSIKAALEQVLKDVPALKPTQGANSGFQLGAPGGNNSNQANEDALKRAFGL